LGECVADAKVHSVASGTGRAYGVRFALLEQFVTNGAGEIGLLDEHVGDIVLHGVGASALGAGETVAGVVEFSEAPWAHEDFEKPFLHHGV